MNIIERAFRRIDAAQQRHGLPAFVLGVIKKYGDDNGGTLAAQLTYAMFLTVFPLLLLLLTILGMVFAGDPSLRHQVAGSAFGQFPIVGRQLSHNIHSLQRGSVFGLVIGFAGLVYGSTRLSQAGLFAMEEVWNIPGAIRPNYVTRMARSFVFLLVLAVGLVLTTALAGFGTFGRHDFWLGLGGEVVAAALNSVLYLAAFRVLTPKQVATRSLLPGAVAGGIAWTVLQAVGGYVVGHDLRGASALYGTFGVVLGLMAWLYLGVQITLYSAELNSVIANRLWPRGMVQPPLTAADQKSAALQSTENQRRPEQVVVTRFTERPMEQDEYRRRGYRSDEEVPGLKDVVPEDAEPESAAKPEPEEERRVSG